MSGKEKGKFEDMAKQDKVRYDQEMQHYMPGKKGKKKDPNAPKRPPYVHTVCVCVCVCVSVCVCVGV